MNTQYCKQKTQDTFWLTAYMFVCFFAGALQKVECNATRRPNAVC